METINSSGSIQFLFLALFIIPAIFFILTQQNTLKAIQPENRMMSAGQVWLQLIPLFGLAWQFFVVIKISDSLRKELTMRNNIFSFESQPADAFLRTQPKPTYQIGLAYCILMCCSVIMPTLLKGLLALAGMICWVIYWVQLSNYKKEISQYAV